MDNLKEKEIITELKKVSYSQYSEYKKCPYSWYLSYAKKMKKYSDSIHTVFGTAIHECLQSYINALYTKSALEADQLNLNEQFIKKYDSLIKESKNLKVSDKEYDEFLNDGKIILEYFTLPSNRIKFFPTKRYEIIGIEYPLDVPLKNGNMKYCGFLDLVLKDKSTGKIKIIDFKTSTRGWNEYQREDKTKLNQLLLYKIFYHKIFGVDLKDIEVEFIILKRKLIENVSFPQSRLQKVVPHSELKSCKDASNDFNEFLKKSFVGGERNQKETDFPRTPGTNRKNCKYCEYSNLNNGKCFGNKKTEYIFTL
jgi:hypothetical protein